RRPARDRRHGARDHRSGQATRRRRARPRVPDRAGRPERTRQAAGRTRARGAAILAARPSTGSGRAGSLVLSLSKDERTRSTNRTRTAYDAPRRSRHRRRHRARRPLRRAHDPRRDPRVAPALDAAQRDPRTLLVWAPIARRARVIAPDDMASLDRAFGAPFPFAPDAVQTAHARWTADWLAWEQTHDAEYKAKAREAEHDRAKLDLVEREKLDRYQRRYQEYVHVSKALQALMSAPQD